MTYYKQSSTSGSPAESLFAFFVLMPIVIGFMIFKFAIQVIAGIIGIIIEASRK